MTAMVRTGVLKLEGSGEGGESTGMGYELTSHGKSETGRSLGRKQDRSKREEEGKEQEEEVCLQWNSVLFGGKDTGHRQKIS